MPDPLLTDDLALGKAKQVVYETAFVWGSPRTIWVSLTQLQEDDSELPYDLTGCTFKLYAWKEDTARTAIVNGATMTASGNSVPIQLTRAQAILLPRVGHFVLHLTVAASGIDETPLVVGQQQIRYG